MPAYTDQTGYTIYTEQIPRSIVSVVPSQTELLYDLGLGETVKAITKFCIHPDIWFREKLKIGGTKKLDTDKIISLQPDLIIANKEENSKVQIDLLKKHVPVWISDVHDLTSAFDMIQSVGDITGKPDEADRLIIQIRESFKKMPDVSRPLRTAYLVWQKPYMTVGKDTFINDMMRMAGFQNVFTDKTRYPEITLQDIRDAGTECLLLSSEPFPFKKLHVDILQEELPGIKILLADGEMFSWYGSRMKMAPGYFSELKKRFYHKGH